MINETVFLNGKDLAERRREREKERIELHVNVLSIQPHRMRGREVGREKERLFHSSARVVLPVVVHAEL